MGGGVRENLLLAKVQRHKNDWKSHHGIYLEMDWLNRHITAST